jgi:ADP-ribose pyrophosphatase YjhB (NUDIX family)
MIASVYGFFIRDEKILLLRRLHTGYEDGKYSLPAGHVDDNESFITAVCREIKEETGVTVSSTDIDLVHIMHRKENDIRMDFFFLVKSWKGQIENTEPDKCDDLSWFSLHNLPDNIIPYIKTAIENYQKRILYAERGWI